MYCGFRFAANKETREENIIVTDPQDGYVVMTIIVGKTIKHARSRIASVSRIQDAMTKLFAIERHPPLSKDKVQKIRQNLLSNDRTRGEVRDFLLPLLKSAINSEL